MSVETFIPKIWSARILEALDKTLVYATLVNRDYEGEISDYGDTVVINTIGDPEIKDYVKNADIEPPDAISTADQNLLIDQGKYFNIAIDDVDKAQARGDLIDTASSRNGYAFADIADSYLAGLLAAGTVTTDLGTTAAPIEITADNAYEYLVKMRTALDKANLPKIGRWIVIPPEYEGLLVLDARFAASTSDVANERLENGTIGRAAGFDVYTSNNVPVASDASKVIASTNISATYAQQILKTEAYRPERRFADAVKGLHVYGSKVTRPEAIGVLSATFGA